MAYAMRTKTNNSIILENFTMEKKKKLLAKLKSVSTKHQYPKTYSF